MISKNRIISYIYIVIKS